MNKDLFDSMQKQMGPSPEVRAALTEKLAQPAKRRTPVRKYMAVAACAALVIGGFSVYRLYQGQPKRALIVQNYHPNSNIQHLHSYVLMAGLETGVSLNGQDATAELNTEAGAEDIYSSGPVVRNADAPSATETAPAPGGVVQDDRIFISQEEAIKLYDILWNYFCEEYGLQEENFSPNWPDWYGGGYLNNDRPDRVARLTLVLVKDYDTPALRQEIYDFLGSDHVDFRSGKYSFSYLHDLQYKLRDYPVIWGSFASCGTDEENNRLNLTLTEVTDEALMALAELDPDDDAIYVQTGRRIILDVAVNDMGEDLAVMPGGAVVPEYGVEDLPERKQPAVQSVPEEDVSTSSYNPDR